jgi:hypothetical protein
MVYRRLLIAQTWTLPEWRAEPSSKGYSSIDIKGCWSWLRGVYTDEDSDVVGGEKGRRCDMFPRGRVSTAPPSQHVEPVIFLRGNI